MNFVAVVMVVTGVLVSAGAVLEFLHFGPASRQFWVGVFTTPAGIFSAGAGILLWRVGHGVRRTVLAAGLGMASATIAATALDVMGPPATLIGVVGALVTVAWAWRHSAIAV